MPKSKSKLKSLLSAHQSAAASVAAQKGREEFRERKERSIAISRGQKVKKPVVDKSKVVAAASSSVGGGGSVKGSSSTIDNKSVNPNPKGKQKQIYPFEQDDTILLIGEGNFSYTLSLLLPQPPRSATSPSQPLTHSHPPHLILSTSYDSESTCYEKYPDAADIVSRIRALGGQIEFDIDARSLSTNKLITGGSSKGSTTTTTKERWSKIVFMFPHAGAGIKDQDRNILTNQYLLLGFLREAAPLLTEGESKFPVVVRGKGSGGRSKLRKNKKEKEDEEDIVDSDDEGMEIGEGDDDINSEPEDNYEQSYLPTTTTTSSGKPTFTIPRKEGTLLITLKDSKPYTLWDLKSLATHPPRSLSIGAGSGSVKMKDREEMVQPRYRLLRSFAFNPSLYQGYEHRRTLGFKEGVSKGGNEEILRGEGGCRTWEFAVRGED